MAKLSSILLQNTPVRTKRQTHILQLWKNSNSRVTSAHKTFLLYLTFPVCASPQPGHQWNPFQQLLHLALSQASRDPYWRNTNKCKQPRLALHFWPVRNSLPSVPPLQTVTGHTQKGHPSPAPPAGLLGRHWLQVGSICLSCIVYNPLARPEPKPNEAAARCAKMATAAWCQPSTPPSVPRPGPAAAHRQLIHFILWHQTDLPELYECKKLLTSYPQSSFGNEVIHAIYILIYQQ